MPFLFSTFRNFLPAAGFYSRDIVLSDFTVKTQVTRTKMVPAKASFVSKPFSILFFVLLFSSQPKQLATSFSIESQATGRHRCTRTTPSSQKQNLREKSILFSQKPPSSSDSIDYYESLVNDFCQGTNEFWKRLVIPPVRKYVEVRPAVSGKIKDVWTTAVAPPEVPGIPRPVWFVITASVFTGLGWYGYYKFSIEEELYQYELQRGEKVSGCGGYGTLFPFVYGILVGFPLTLLHLPLGPEIIQAASLWILLGQVNLYRRVNELCLEVKEDLGIEEPPLYTWWALLPPPIDVIVGLRQVHFLSEYWRVIRKEEAAPDIVANEWFPFISSERFTLRTLVQEPSRWFWFTKDWKNIDIPFLRELE